VPGVAVPAVGEHVERALAAPLVAVAVLVELDREGAAACKQRGAVRLDKFDI
jgi:hypothetical protein